jgi:hypothetical protein
MATQPESSILHLHTIFAAVQHIVANYTVNWNPEAGDSKYLKPHSINSEWWTGMDLK